MKIILDTDIGSDADDAMALVQLLALKVEVLGITTAYGPTDFRARIAQHYLSLMGSKAEVFAGEQEPMSGKKVWLSGREGRVLPNLDAVEVSKTPAIQFLKNTLRETQERITILAIAPLTNIARVLEAEPSLAQKIEQIVVMGGDFRDGTQEHNFASDSRAAAIVMASGIEITLVGLDATTQLKLYKPQIDQIAAAGRTGKTLEDEILDWWDYWKETWSVPHDPIAIVALLSPELFEFSPKGTVEILQGGELDGVSIFKPGLGNSRYVETFDLDRVAKEIIDSIVLGCAQE